MIILSKSMVNINTNPNNIFYIYSKSESCKVDNHLNDSYEIFMALSNNIKYFVEGSMYELSKGDIIITTDLEVHRPQVINSDPYERRFIQFKPQFFSQILDAEYNPLKIFTRRVAGKGNKISLSLHKNTPILSYFDSIGDCYKKGDAKNNLLMYSYMIQLLICLDEIYIANTNSLKTLKNIDNRVTKVLTFIEDNYKNKISLDILCESLFIDKFYMSHLFKEATGFTIVEYIQSKRIQNAKKLIMQGKSMTEVCYSSGFEDYSNFYKTFKKLVKLSPKKYSKKYSDSSR
ncbi:AraC family transcriptional regulator [Clostridium grantii]|uniref:AraC-like ligand binding domain-containing protein n=1 Tax=Clostridium grantii DSM 8605 TaxID=1121316 RepID=A0A1M5XSY6_9CLOT|nr:AraC family transcriptional regulator [Clostridium grantii]SHI02628.1 AraC-like ligand binding domain-containing protein [Clostridium grantii DSM 8605]